MIKGIMAQTDSVRSGIGTKNKFMLGDEVIMSDRDSFGQTSRSTTEEPCCGRCLSCLQVIESHPILLAKGHQLSPGLHAIWDGLTHVVECPHIAGWDVSLLGGFKNRFQDLRL